MDFIIETEGVYCAVRSESINIIQIIFILQSVKRWTSLFLVPYFVTIIDHIHQQLHTIYVKYQNIHIYCICIYVK